MSEKMSFEEFKTWADAAKDMGILIVFGPGSKAPEEFKKYVSEAWLGWVQGRENQCLVVGCDGGRECPFHIKVRSTAVSKRGGVSKREGKNDDENDNHP